MSARGVIKEAFDNRRYIIAITYIDAKTGIRQHRLEMKDFPTEDILGSFDEMKKLAVKGAGLDKPPVIGDTQQSPASEKGK